MSLRWRLIALYAAILGAVLAVFAFLLTHRLHEDLLAALDRELTMRARALAAELEFEPGRWFVESTSELLADYRAGGRHYFLVADGTGVVMLGSPSLSVPAPAFPATLGCRELSLGGEPYREVSLALAHSPDEEGSGAPITLQVAVGTSLASVESAMASMRAQLWAIGPAMLLLSMLGGFLLVARSLRPIEDITCAAERISAADLSQRIDVRGKDELARLGRTLNATFARLQAAFERERRFTADASHELRTPLAVIAGNAELAQSRERSAPELRELFADVAAASAHMQMTVEGMLALARADAGVAALQRQLVSLAAVADAALRLQRALSEQRAVMITCEASDPGFVRGDPALLRELVVNLLSNAIRYNRRGGNATVRVRTDSENSCVELTVVDTGIGIRAEDLPRVFDRFFRADPARSRGDDGCDDMGGAGLGLAIVKGIVDAHGGKVSVASELGVGSSFMVTLPLDHVGTAASPRPRPPTAQ